jgi:drug/metabolite transporter (DMT)-like permease
MLSKGVIYMLISTLSFSLMNICIKVTGRIPFFELILFRSIISLVLSFYYIRKNNLSLYGNNKKDLILRGIFGTIALSLLFASLQNLPLASAATISYLGPIFTAIFAIYILKEKVKPIQWFFFLIAFSGVVLIKGFDNNVDGIYVLAAVASAVFSGLAYNMVRKLRTTDHPVVVVFYFPVVAIPFMLILSILYWVPPIGNEWLLIIAIGLLAHIGQIYLSKALYLENAARISSIQFLGIITAILFSVFMFKEQYSFANLVGIIFVTLGVVMNLYFTQQKKTDLKPTAS